MPADGLERPKGGEVKVPLPSVSIVVPYFETSLDDLACCIRCLRNQQYPAEKLEIVIVDNHVLPSLTRDKLGTDVPDNISIIHESAPGSYTARNRGIMATSGAVIAFTDADCAPSSTWLTEAVWELRRLQFRVALAGAIEFTFRKQGAPNMWERFDSTIHLKQERYVTAYHFGATANLIVPRIFFCEIGLFNEAFYSGGDREWGERLHSRGIPLQFSRRALVQHRARALLRDVVHKNRRGVGADLIRSGTDGSFGSTVLGAQMALCARRYRILLEDYRRNENLGNYAFIQLSLVLLLIHLVRSIEAVRLMCGGIPVR